MHTKLRLSSCLLLGLALACIGAPLSCANSGEVAPPPPSDAGKPHRDATMTACGEVGQSCCEPPTECNPGGWCDEHAHICKTSRPADLGRPCASPGGCSTGICGYTQGISADATPMIPDGNGTPPPSQTGCTVGCFNTTPDCLAGWTCQHLMVGQGTCVCSWSPEICDGKDNNCDGIVDNEPEADNYCTMMDDGIPQKCVHGGCKCVNTCKGSCVDISTDDMNCGMCGKTCTPMIERCENGHCACAYTMCGPDCVNTMGTDNMNCGGCSMPCSYQCAEGSCGPATFAGMLSDAGAIAVDGTNVYWIDRGKNHTQVQYCPQTGCPGGNPETLAQSSAASFYAGNLRALLVTSSSVYFADDGGHIEVTPITGGTGTGTAFSTSADTLTFVTATSTDLVWADNSLEKVFSCALGTSCATPTSVANLVPKGISPLGIGVSGANAYWAGYNFISLTIQTAPIAGGTAPTPVCSAPGFTITDLLVAGTNVYFTDGADVRVCSLSSTGGAADVFYADKNTPAGLASDGTDLFWTEDKANGAILKCALGTSCSSPTTVATNVKNPFGIAVTSSELFVTSHPGTGGAVLYFHK